MAKYILGVPAMVGHSDIVTSYQTKSDLEGLFVSIVEKDTVGIATSSSAIIGVSQAKNSNLVSVGQGKHLPVMLDENVNIDNSIYGKPVYMTAEGKATDKTEEGNTQTPFIFSSIQPTDGEVIKQSGEIVKGALIDTI